MHCLDILQIDSDHLILYTWNNFSTIPLSPTNVRIAQSTIHTIWFSLPSLPHSLPNPFSRILSLPSSPSPSPNLLLPSILLFASGQAPMGSLLVLLLLCTILLASSNPNIGIRAWLHPTWRSPPPRGEVASTRASGPSTRVQRHPHQLSPLLRSLPPCK